MLTQEDIEFNARIRSFPFFRVLGSTWLALILPTALWLELKGQLSPDTVPLNVVSILGLAFLLMWPVFLVRMALHR